MKAKQTPSEFTEPLRPISYRLNLKANEETIDSLFKVRGVVVKLALPKPVKSGGETYSWIVHPVRLFRDAPLEELGPQVFCRDEAEAIAEEKRWEAVFREQDEEAARKERERPIPGETLKFAFVVGVQKLTVTGTPLAMLKHYTHLPKCSSSAFDEEPPFVDVCNSYWESKDGSSGAMKAVITEVRQSVEAFRIVQFTEPVKNESDLFEFAVEYGEFDQERKILRAMERWFCSSQNEAMRLFTEKEKGISALRAKLLNEPAPTAEDLKDEQLIRDIQALAERADAAGKKRHLKRIEEIRAGQKERKRLAAEAEAARLKREQKKHAALHLLLAQNFPNVEKLKQENKGIGKVTPEYAEQLKRAMRIDCARLGLPSPCNPATSDDEFVLQVAGAIKAKSPFKPEQTQAVLHWFGKYENMREEDWTADVAKTLKKKIKPGGLGKTVSKKFGLKSKLKGRPETESGKNGET